jgi:hypothetical protein
MQALTLEALLTSRHGFALTTASPLQRAVCRIIDGLPLGELASREEVRSAIGDVDGLPTAPPAEVLILSGIRTAKSLSAAATAVRASQTCDVSGLGAGETPRVSVVSLTVDLSKVVFDHIVGNVLARPALKALLIGEPTADTVTLRHPSGRAVDIKVVAGARAGASLVARWSAGCIFDEAPRMIGSDDGVVNYDDCRAAVIGRLLPGAQVISIGSPWAPFGPIYERVMERQGKPGPDLVIVRAPAHHMNPVHWTPQRIEELRAKDPQVYRTDILGEFADPETSLFSSAELELVTRAAPAVVPPEDGHYYAAAMDPATRGNSWTLCIATRKWTDDGLRSKDVVVLAKQWTGSKLAPLSPNAVLKEIAALCRQYRMTYASTDQYAADALRDLARQHKLHLRIEPMTAQRNVDVYEGLRAKLADGRVELPPDATLRADLLSVRKRVTQSGVRIELPRTSDGRHADFAPAIALVLDQPIREPDVRAPAPIRGTPEYEQAFMQRIAGGIVRRRNEARTRAPWITANRGGR